MENPNIIDIKSISLSGRLKHFLKLVLLAKVLPGLYIVKRQKLKLFKKQRKKKKKKMQR